MSLLKLFRKRFYYDGMSDDIIINDIAVSFLFYLSLRTSFTSENRLVRFALQPATVPAQFAF